MKKVILILLTSVVSAVSFATVDSIGSGKIPYSPVHAAISFEDLTEDWGGNYANTKGYCMTSFMYYDHYSSSALPQFDYMMKPFHIPSFPEEHGLQQINELADGVVKITTDWEKFEQYVALEPDKAWESPLVHEPEFVVDVSGYDKSTKAGRLESITMAKLAVISLHYNLSGYGSLFRLKIEVVGLPEDQSEFAKEGFSLAVAKTVYPYSRPSPLAQAYYKDLISEDFCGRVAREVKTFVN